MITGNRYTLALSKLDDFAAWAENHGFNREPSIGVYEVLRLRPEQGGKPLIYFKRASANVHASCQLDGLKLVKRWIQERD